MIIDDKGRLFGRVSIVDIIIVLVVLLALGGVGYKLTRTNAPTPFAKQDTISIDFYFEEVPDYVADYIKPGMTVRDIQKGFVIGTVKSISVDKSVVYAVADTGEIKVSTKPGYKSIRMTVEGTGKFSETGVTFGSSEYYTGKFYEYGIGDYSIYGRMGTMKKKE